MNRFKTFLLLALLTGLFMAVGRIAGGESGMIMGFLFALVSNFVSYFFSDKLVLNQYGATPLTPQTQPHVYALVEKLAQQSDLPMPKLYLIDMPTPNAFATGRDPHHAALAVSPSLLEMMNTHELEGVLAHELGHIKHYDTLISTLAATVAGALSYLTQLFAFSAPGSRSDDERRGGGLSVLFLLLVSPIIASLLFFAISRQREYGADEFAARLTRKPSGLANALAKLHNIAERYPLQGTPSQETSAHLFIINPFDVSSLQALFSTHPPVQDRIHKLQNIHL